MQKSIATNRRAYHDYFILETLEAGIALTGTEIKSVREGKVNLREAYAKGEGDELWLYNVHIAHYQPGGPFSHDPTRPRKLLLHRKELNQFLGQANQKGLTIVPLRLYLKGRLAKVEIALAQGKKLYDKRQAIAERQAQREVERALRRPESRNR